MNGIAYLIEHPTKHAVERGKMEDRSELDRQARKVARMFAEYETERKILEAMYQRSNGLKG